jgi:hypothetical protein
MLKVFKQFMFVMMVFTLFFSLSVSTHADELSTPIVSGKEQVIEFKNLHYGPMLVFFIQEGEASEIQNASMVILGTGQKVLHKFSATGFQEGRVIQVRHYGGVWEAKVDGDTISLSSVDIIKEENCLKANRWGKKEYSRKDEPEVKGGGLKNP